MKSGSKEKHQSALQRQASSKKKILGNEVKDQDALEGSHKDKRIQDRSSSEKNINQRSNPRIRPITIRNAETIAINPKIKDGIFLKEVKVSRQSEENAQEQSSLSVNPVYPESNSIQNLISRSEVSQRPAYFPPPMQLNNDHQKLEQKDHWKLVDKFLTQNGPAQLQIDSYNDFLDNLPRLINQQGKFKCIIEHQFQLNIEVPQQVTWQMQFQCHSLQDERPVHMNADSTLSKTTPQMCRTRDLSYEVDLKADIHYRKVVRERGRLAKRVVEQSQQKTLQNVVICTIPVMVKSRLCRLTDFPSQQQHIQLQECTLDQGGYFIINGSQKVVNGQQRTAYNEIMTYKNKSESEPWISQIRSKNPKKGQFPQLFRLLIKIDKQVPRVYAQLKNVPKPLPLFILIKALGVPSDIDIIELICEQVITEIETSKNSQELKKIFQILQNSAQKSKISTKAMALAFIGSQMPTARTDSSDKAVQVLAHENLLKKLLPHLGKQDLSNFQKAHFIANMARRLIITYITNAKQMIVTIQATKGQISLENYYCN